MHVLDLEDLGDLDREGTCCGLSICCPSKLRIGLTLEAQLGGLDINRHDGLSLLVTALGYF